MSVTGEVTEGELKTHQEKIGGRRVTLEALKDNIDNTFVGRASDLFLDPERNSEEFHPLDLLTIAVVVLKNGFTVIGESACADPTMYNQDIGERLAIENAEKKIWALMGYNLKQDIYENGDGKNTFKDRLVREATEVETRLTKLKGFIGGNIHFGNLVVSDQKDLNEQAHAMDEYLQVLKRRISNYE